MMTSGNPLVAMARALVLGAVAALPPLRRRVTRALAGLDYPPVPD